MMLASRLADTASKNAHSLGLLATCVSEPYTAVVLSTLDEREASSDVAVDDEGNHLFEVLQEHRDLGVVAADEVEVGRAPSARVGVVSQDIIEFEVVAKVRLQPLP